LNGTDTPTVILENRPPDVGVLGLIKPLLVLLNIKAEENSPPGVRPQTSRDTIIWSKLFASSRRIRDLDEEEQLNGLDLE